MTTLAQMIKRLALLFALVLLLFLALFLLGCGSNISLLSPDRPVSSEEIPTIEGSKFSQEDVEAADQGDSRGDSIALPDEKLSSQGDSVTPSIPELGEIVFAPAVTANNEPINPSFIFTAGITKVHAIFEYSGMSEDNVWERVWYLNEQEISREASPWPNPGRGLFDYSIDNEGKPLPPGDWILELYLDGRLQGLGVFIIEE